MKTKNPFYLLKSEAFRYLWLLNFALKLPNYATTFGIPQAWVDEIVANSALLDKVMKLLESLKKAANNVTIFKDLLFNQNPDAPSELVFLRKFLIELNADISSLPNIFDRAISVANMILENPLCDDIIKKDLKLIKPTETEAVEATGRSRKPVVGNAPVVKAKVAGDVVTLTIVKGKQFKGMMANIFVSRTDKEELSLLGTTNKGSFTDKATFGEGVLFVTYTYQVQMMDGSVPKGEPSEPIIIVVPKPLGLRIAA